MSALAKKSALTEREWLNAYGQSFGDDQQAMLHAQLVDILRGQLSMEINDNHVAAYKAEAAPLHKFLEGF